jgi:hypothetical protein
MAYQLQKRLCTSRCDIYRIFPTFTWIFIFLFNAGCQTLGFYGSDIPQVSRTFQDMDTFKSWFVFYYQDPKPQELTSALLFMEKNGLLAEYPEVASMFVAQIFSAHPENASLWIKGWEKSFSERQWTVVVVALWLTDKKELQKTANTLLAHFPKVKRAKMSEMLKTIPSSSLNPLFSDVQHIGQVNMLWAGFSATGDNKYVERVISLVSRFAGPAKLQKKSIGEAALVSLAQNTLLHPSVEESVKKAEKTHPDPTTRALIQAMLQALASIDKRDYMLPNSPAH